MKPSEIYTVEYMQYAIIFNEMHFSIGKRPDGSLPTPSSHGALRGSRRLAAGSEGGSHGCRCVAFVLPINAQDFKPLVLSDISTVFVYCIRMLYAVLCIDTIDTFGF